MPRQFPGPWWYTSVSFAHVSAKEIIIFKFIFDTQIAPRRWLTPHECGGNCISIAPSVDVLDLMDYFYRAALSSVDNRPYATPFA